MRLPTAGRTVVSFLGAATATVAARRLLDLTTAPVARSVTRTNHRGEDVSLLEGPAVTVGAITGLALSGAGALPVVVATTGGALFGLLDDLTEDVTTRRKGLRGHLGALARGELTTGGAKVLGIGATSLVAAALIHRGDGRGRAGRTLDVAVTGALVAGSANLLNLLDLRPGRALKALGVAASPWLRCGQRGGPATAALLGAA
ncbi:hypothetical protein N869_07995, partial [Cellulomonas bogoriensis 69B4 = DSM 16987]